MFANRLSLEVQIASLILEAAQRPNAKIAHDRRQLLMLAAQQHYDRAINSCLLYVDAQVVS